MSIDRLTIGILLICATMVLWAWGKIKHRQSPWHNLKIAALCVLGMLSVGLSTFHEPDLPPFADENDFLLAAGKKLGQRFAASDKVTLCISRNEMCNQVEKGFLMTFKGKVEKTVEIQYDQIVLAANVNAALEKVKGPKILMLSYPIQGFTEVAEFHQEDNKTFYWGAPCYPEDVTDPETGLLPKSFQYAICLKRNITADECLVPCPEDLDQAFSRRFDFKTDANASLNPGE